eukprot:1902967-Prymnesium_polylepis.1
MAMAATMRARRGRGLQGLLCSRARPGASSILAQNGCMAARGGTGLGRGLECQLSATGTTKSRA